MANFHTISHLFIADRGRERFEATIRLGNASLFNSYENGERRINQHFVILFEKHVSRTFLPHELHSSLFYYPRLHFGTNSAQSFFCSFR